MSFTKKTYPATIVLKKNIVVIVAGVLVIVMGVIVYNFSHPPTRSASTEKPVKTVYTQPALKWYQQPVTLKPDPNRALLPNNPPPVARASNLAGMSAGATGLSSPARVDPQTTSVKPVTDPDPDLEAEKKAMRAPITSNQLIGIVPNPPGLTNPQRSAKPGESTDDPNGQSQKKAFLEINNQPAGSDYLSSSLQPLASPYEIQAGTVIPAELITGVNSDLPGQITGQVRSHVYDSPTGAHLLIPQGSRVVGLYDSAVAYGQKRVLVVWKRIIFPSGESINLEGMPGVDLSGYAGFHDKVNNHYAQLLGSVLLMSALTAGAELSQPQSNNGPWQAPSISQTLASSLGTNISDVGVALINKNLNVQPTLEIRPGYLFNITVTKDMVFPGPYRPQ